MRSVPTIKAMFELSVGSTSRLRIPILFLISLAVFRIGT